MTIAGNSGKLKTTLVGDFLSHEDLLELEQERKEYFEKKTKSQVVDADYVPIDF